MNIGDITLQVLIKDTNVRKSVLDNQYLFSSDDLNYNYMGAFRELKVLLIPVKNAQTGNYDYTGMIPAEYVQMRIDEMKKHNPFEQLLFTAMKYDPRKDR